MTVSVTGIIKVDQIVSQSSKAYQIKAWVSDIYHETHVMTVHLWADIGNFVAVPVCETNYLLAGKMTKSVDGYVIEATMLDIILLEIGTLPPPLNFYGTATVDSTFDPHAEVILMQTKCYAAKIESQIDLKITYSSKQYSNFMIKVISNQEITFMGLFKGITGTRLDVMNGQFSYLSKKTTTTVTQPRTPITFTNKAKGYAWSPPSSPSPTPSSMEPSMTPLTSKSKFILSESEEETTETVPVKQEQDDTRKKRKTLKK